MKHGMTLIKVGGCKIRLESDFKNNVVSLA